MKNKLEVWMRGPIADIPALLQPVAHVFLQVQEDVTVLLDQFPDEKLWIRPNGLASVAFHLQHICGVIDRMFTYAQKKQLSPQQFTYLEKEGIQEPNITVKQLIAHLDQQLKASLGVLKEISEEALKEARTIGRKKIPTTLIGLLFHAAEHVQRHLGQLLVTSKIVKEDY